MVASLSVVGKVLCTILLIATAWGAFGVGRDAFLVAESLRWPSTAGQIIKREQATKSVGFEQAYLEYRYQVGSRWFSSSKVSFYRRSKWSSNEWNALVGSFPPSGSVPVFYNPKEPSLAVLEPGGSNLGNFAFLGVQLLVAFALLWLLIRSFRLDRQSQRETLDFESHEMTRRISHSPTIPVDRLRSVLPACRFLTVFGILMAGYYVLAMWIPFDRLLFDYLRLNAWLSGSILDLFGQGVTVSGVEIQSVEAVIAVRKGCDAIEPAWMFSAAVLAFPAPWRSKLYGIVAGVSALLLLNLVRIVTLFLAKSYVPEWFPTIHLEIWPMAFILSAILLWNVWFAWTKREARDA